jgi:hypothetical protein
MAAARQGLPVRLDRAPQRGAAFAITRASRRARTRPIGSPALCNCASSRPRTGPTLLNPLFTLRAITSRPAGRAMRQSPRLGSATDKPTHPSCCPGGCWTEPPRTTFADCATAYINADAAKVASARLGCATLWLLPRLPSFARLMTQLEGQTGEPLSYQFQFVVCAHHDQPVDARLDGARVLHGTFPSKQSWRRGCGSLPFLRAWPAPKPQLAE